MLSNYKFHSIPLFLLASYFIPNFFWLSVLAGLFGALFYISYTRIRFWRVLTRKIEEYKV
jgi:hypothetical protein